jgi:hypothetical protein
MAPRARAKAATTTTSSSSARGRLKDLTNGDDDKKTKPKASNTKTTTQHREKRCPDSRPSRMTASVVAMEASAEKKETFRHNKRRRTTTTTTTSKNTNTNTNNTLEKDDDDDDLDVTCDETTRSLPAKRKHLLRSGAHAKGLVEGKKNLSFKFFFSKIQKCFSLPLSLSLLYILF